MRPMNSDDGKKPMGKKPAMKGGGKKAPKKPMMGSVIPPSTPPAPMAPPISTKPPMFPNAVTPPIGTSGKGMPTIDPMSRFRGK